MNDGQSETALRERQVLAEGLQHAGVFLSLDEETRTQVIQKMVNGRSPLDGLFELGWPADGEDLAEGDVETLLAGMASALELEGLSLEVESIERPWDADSRGYRLRINGTEVLLYEVGEDGVDGVPRTEDPWLDCTLKPLAEVNHLLRLKGSSKRAAVFCAGANDGFVLLLDSQVLDLLSNSEALTDGERPIVPQ